MKIKTIFAASLLATGVAFADTAAVDAECVIGVLPVALAANQKEIILNIPWIEAGQPSEGVAVTNLVKTAGLGNNDTLLWYNKDSGYQSWRIVNNAWVPTPIVGKGSLPTTTAATATVLNRGQALILNRTGTAATNIYVVGQYASTPATAPTIAPGTPKAPVYTLIAPPNTTGSVNLKNAFSTPVDGDGVTFMKDGTLKSYYYVIDYDGTSDGWCSVSFDKKQMKEVYTAASDEQMTLPVGTGLYYKSCGTAPTVSWL